MRTLTISIEPDLDTEMAQFAERAKRGIETGQYQGEYLNFATPGTFFGHLSTHRWGILTCLLDAGTLGVRELARRMGRDVKRVHEDAQALVQLGLLEKNARGALHCPYSRIDIDMALVPRALMRDRDAPIVDSVVAQRMPRHARHPASGAVAASMR